MQRFLRIVVVGLVACVGFFFPLLAPTRHRIDHQHFQLIKSGMSAAEVEAIFGVGAGEYDWAVMDTEAALWLVDLAVLEARIVQYETGTRMSALFEVSPKLEKRQWISSHGIYTVFIDTDGRVASKHALGRTRIEYPWQRWWHKLTGK
jgi:hypothetical protein